MSQGKVKSNNEAIKRQLGLESAALVKDHMIVGLGTGSTAFFFIESLIERCKQGLKIQAIASSIKSQEHAQKGGIPLLNPGDMTYLDIYVDGADEVDPQNRLIKGRGGALVREKILASSAKKMVVIVDESKLVQTLGKAHLPIEILPFGYKSTVDKIERGGFKGKIRREEIRSEGNSFYITDNGNYILDIDSPLPFANPEETNQILINIPGVVDTGFFFHLATDVLIGYSDKKLMWRHG